MLARAGTDRGDKAKGSPQKPSRDAGTGLILTIRLDSVTIFSVPGNDSNCSNYLTLRNGTSIALETPGSEQGCDKYTRPDVCKVEPRPLHLPPTAPDVVSRLCPIAHSRKVGSYEKANFMVGANPHGSFRLCRRAHQRPVSLWCAGRRPI